MNTFFKAFDFKSSNQKFKFSNHAKNTSKIAQLANRSSKSILITSKSSKKMKKRLRTKQSTTKSSVNKTQNPTNSSK
jgi:hypothetical protein